MNLGGGRRGFTLVEMMVALTLLAIGGLALAAFSVTINEANRSSTNRTRADQLLGESMEELQSMPYVDIVSRADTVVVGGVRFERLREVTPDTPVAGVKQVDLEARWTDGQTTLTQSTSTLIGMY